MRVEEIIGRRIRLQREFLKMSQSQLGGRVGAVLGRDWPRQAVSAAERGQRSFTAAELVALALSLHTTVDWFMVPPADVTEISLGGHGTWPRDVVASVVLPKLGRGAQDEAQALEEIEAALASLARNLTDAKTGIWAATDDVHLLTNRILRAREVIALRRTAAGTEPDTGAGDAE